MKKMKFIKLTDLIAKYLFKYEELYGREALIAYLKGFIRGLKEQK
jgi:hypothetical protein